MRKITVCLLIFPAILFSQITRTDVQFAGLSARTAQMAYTQRGGDMKPIAPLMAEMSKALADPVAAYRGLTHAIVVMNGLAWTPATELPTGLDFSIQAKVLGTGDSLETRATFLFDAPAATDGPYKLDLEILSPTSEKEASVERGITLGDIRGRRGGETIGVVFDPSKFVKPGAHLLRATLKDGHGATLHQYYRSFAIVPDLGVRMAALGKTLALLPDQKSTAALSARYVLETVELARRNYLGGSFQNLTGFLYAAYRRRGLGLTELMDFDAELARAAQLASALDAGKNPVETAKGDLRLAYRSTFDGKLVPYRLYIPSGYDRSRRYPMIVFLHGAGGDENNALDDYQQQWPRLAEQHGYILASVNGRGAVSGYAKQNGGEQDVLDVLELVKKGYSVDAKRVFLAGHSMGSAGTWRIGLDYRDRFAGLAPIAGSAVSLALETSLGSGAKIPIIIVAGVKDALVPVAGCRAAAEKAKSLGWDVKYAEYADGDHLSVVPMSLPDVFAWFNSRATAAR